MSQSQWVIASNNPKKRKEMAAILASLGVSIVPAEDTIFVDVAEDGDTFADNAAKKAIAFMQTNQTPALADDSGLCVDALDGAPGVYSARFAGEHARDADNNAKLLTALSDASNRQAHFVCHLHVAFPNGQAPLIAEGSVQGCITLTQTGSQGFGYDPIFYCPELGKTFADASPDEKASVSHRGRALRNLVAQMQSL